MHVSFIGAGVLGRVYGTRLARSLVDVSFVVRPARLQESEPFVIEQVNGDQRRDALEAPKRVATAPAESSAVIVTVRADQLGAELAPLVAEAPDAPVIVLTPLLPKARASLEHALGRPVVPAMPGVSGYLSDAGNVRYWIVKAQATLIEEGQSANERNSRGELARHLTRAGIPTRVEGSVGAMNAATTAAFFPFVLAIGLTGSVDAILADRKLLDLTLDAAKETEALAAHLGPIVPAASLLTKFVGPFTLKAGVSLAKRLYPESVSFVEHHFGAKLHAQHRATGEALLELAAKHHVATPALTELVARLVD
jgi:ketopantoate reductase